MAIEHNWKTVAQIKPALPANVDYWLVKVKRLGSALKERYPDITLEQLSQGQTVLKPDERAMLHTREPLAYERLVRQHEGDRTIILAKTVILSDTYLYYRPTIDALGNASIGEDFLFKHPSIKRSGFHLAQFTGAEIQTIFNVEIPEQSALFWARASLFYLNQPYRLLVKEFFLEIPEFVGES